MAMNVTLTRKVPVVNTHPADTDAHEYNVLGMILPATLWVRPSGGTWTITYSTDGGLNYQSLTALTGATTYSETQVTSGISHIKITSSTTDGGTWGYV